jgi:dipeptide/tripeptide permease
MIGAYTIEVLNRTLLRLEVNTEAIKAFKAVFIIVLMVGFIACRARDCRKTRQTRAEKDLQRRVETAVANRSGGTDDSGS